MMQQLNLLMLDLKSYYPSPAYQLGLLVSYATLNEEVKKNAKITFTEHPRQQPAKEIADIIMAADADLVAVSNYAWNQRKIQETLDILTESGAKVPRILLGGPNSAGTFGDNFMKRYPIISAMVEGEGEPAFADICANLVDSPSKDPFQTARNCAIRGENGEILRPNMNHRIQTLDEVPSPYLTGLLPVAPSPLFYETNRGCPYRCSFCYWGNGNAKIYRMSTERVCEEMEFFAKNKVSSFWMADANFGIFKTDAEIAEMMCEINARHGYPFRDIGVNWAKNSSDRVLDIASIFRKGRMTCTTTLAIQSVTPEAEVKSNRYSMAPSKFTHLIRSAHERNLNTYTDIIWGLPGENVDEFLAGLECVISTGVPAIKLHQLYLIPGTEFFDTREELGIKMLSEVSETTLDASERSDFWEYIVVSHPKMNESDMRRGLRLIGINHLLHNHNLGRVVNFYLARHGITISEVYNFFDEALLGQVEDFPEKGGGFLSQIRHMILNHAKNVGSDETIFYRELSELVWFKPVEAGSRRKLAREPEVREFMQDFYRALCRKHGICQELEEMALLSEMIDYNVLISPKPTWKPNPAYTFNYDVDTIFQDMLTEIHNAKEEDSPIQPTDGDGMELAIQRKKKRSEEHWSDLPREVRSRLVKQLSDAYLARMRGPVVYTVENPWWIAPSQENADWLLTSRGKHCTLNRIDLSTRTNLIRKPGIRRSQEV